MDRDIVDGMVEVRAARHEEGKLLAELHLRSFPGYFLSSLGPAFLSLFYERLIRDGEIVFAAVVTGRLIGFAAGSVRPAGFFTRLLRRDGLRFAFASLPALVRDPAIAPRLARAVRKPAEAQRRPVGYGTLLSIGVHPEARGTGCGRQLLESFVAEARARGARGIDLTTDRDDNDRVNAFYLRNGFSVRREFDSPEGRRMYEFERLI